jgi:hypothetical protein
VTSRSGDASTSYSVTDPNPPEDQKCLSVDASAATLNQSEKKIIGITLSRMNLLKCAYNLTIVSMTASWVVASSGEKLRQIHIDGGTVYDDPSGEGSGFTFPFVPQVTMTDTSTHGIDQIRFNNIGNGVTFTLGFNMLDGTTKTVAFVPA